MCIYMYKLNDVILFKVYSAVIEAPEWKYPVHINGVKEY